MKRSVVRKKRLGPPRRGRVCNPHYMAWMHETQACLVTGQHRDGSGRPFELHHVRKNAGDQKDDTRTVALLREFHREGPNAVEKHGDAWFQEAYTFVDFEAEILRCNRQYETETGRALKSVNRNE